jgi:hypothetical protein
MAKLKINAVFVTTKLGYISQVIMTEGFKTLDYEKYLELCQFAEITKLQVHVFTNITRAMREHKAFKDSGLTPVFLSDNRHVGDNAPATHILNKINDFINFARMQFGITS